MGWYKAGHGKKDTKDSTASFVHNRNRENIKSGETHSTIFGKIARYFADLKMVAFTGDYDDLNGKPSSFPPSAHKHSKADITDFPSSLPASDVPSWAKAANKPAYNWSEIGGKPSSFPPSSHNQSSATLKSPAGTAQVNYHEFNAGNPGGSKDGYTAVATITVTQTWMNNNIIFWVRRSFETAFDINISFESNNNTDPRLRAVYTTTYPVWVDATNAGYGANSWDAPDKPVAFLHKDSAGTWTLYIKTGGYYLVCIDRITCSAGVKITPKSVFTQTMPSGVNKRLVLAGTALVYRLMRLMTDTNNPDRCFYGYDCDYNNVDPAEHGSSFVDTDTGTYYYGYILQKEFKSWRPLTDNGMDLGLPSKCWKNVYAAASAISTSDREVKKEISYTGSKVKEYTSTYMDDMQLISLILGLKPCVYKFKDNNSNRPHHGLIAQDVEELLQKLGIKDHAAFIKSPKTRDVEVEEEYTDKDGSKKTRKRTVQEEIPGEYIYGLRYEEFIADVIRFCQILYNRNTELENALKEQEEKTESLEKRIEALENIIKQTT